MSKEAGSTDFLRARDETFRLAGGVLGFGLFEFFLELARARLEPLDSFDDFLVGLRLELGAQPVEGGSLGAEVLERGFARQRHDPAGTGGDPAFTDNFKETDLARIPHMGAAAELGREIP